MIHKSDRKLSRDEYFDVALDLFVEITKMLKSNFGDDKQFIDKEPNPDYWLIKHIREVIMNSASSIIDNLSHHSTIYILSEKDYINRRQCINAILGDIDNIKKHCQLSERSLSIKASRFTLIYDDLDYEIELMKDLRSRDNMIFKRDVIYKKHSD